MLRSISAVLIGFVTVFVLSSLTDFILEALGIFPPIGNGFFEPWMLLLALFYRTVYTVLAGFITVKIAKGNMKPVIILGLIGLLAGSIGVISTWNMDLSPKWYPIALALLAFPSIWIGGKLGSRKK